MTALFWPKRGRRFRPSCVRMDWVSHREVWSEHGNAYDRAAMRMCAFVYAAARGWQFQLTNELLFDILVFLVVIVREQPEYRDLFPVTIWETAHKLAEPRAPLPAWVVSAGLGYLDSDGNLPE